MDNKLVSKWKLTGLLHGCTTPQQEIKLSHALEFFASYLIEHTELPDLVRTLALPTLTRIYNQKPHIIFLFECVKIIECLKTVMPVLQEPVSYSIDAEEEFSANAAKLYLEKMEKQNDTV